MTTLTEVLFDSPEHAKETISTRLGDIALVASLIAGLAQPGLSRQIADRIVDALNSPLAPLIEQAWSSYDEVRATCEQTKEPYTPPAVVVLGSATLELHAPIEVTVHSAQRPPEHLTLDVELTVTVDHITLTISNGQIVSTTAATPTVDAKLSSGGLLIAQRKMSTAQRGADETAGDGGTSSPWWGDPTLSSGQLSVAQPKMDTAQFSADETAGDGGSRPPWWQ